ncbi:hypothetical protein F0U44_07915 [Nocardioides humilatus]|uniref:Uncharacterized protein n=1 Tax=Nocardioides humilatus TaxID=2607660 RepID=A0A5B1LJF4_9ACTN|nr:hypothetical protein [Nocardioides humilatus]KAA1420328.1 hypothetical protein F0U44_07915 [Nocardioides humilatus]
MTQLPALRLLGLVLLGAVISPLGDHIHVATGTTAYDEMWLRIGDSPLWFPLFVGISTAALAETRVRLGGVRAAVSTRWAVGGVAAVMAMYAATGLLRGQPTALGVTLIAGLAIVVWSVIGDGRGAVCGVVAAVTGTATEAILSEAGVFHYASDSDGLLGVAPWLPFLYFTFGVVAAVLGEVSRSRNDQPVSSGG